MKRWLALRRVKSISKCHPQSLPVWADWLKGKIVGVVVRRTDDPTYTHNCWGILVISSRMDWNSAINAICEYLGCSRQQFPQHLLAYLRGTISVDVVLLRQICQTIHLLAERGQN